MPPSTSGGTLSGKPIVDEPGGSSDEEETNEESRYVVRENSRFAATNKARPTPTRSGSAFHFPRRLARGTPDARAAVPASQSTPHAVYGADGEPRERKTSGFFGSITGIFHRHGRSGSVSSFQYPENTTPNSSPPRLRTGRWATRTDRHLKKAGRDDSSDEELSRPAMVDYEALRKKSAIEAKNLPTPGGSPSSTNSHGQGQGTQRKLKKADGNRPRNASPPKKSEPPKALKGVLKHTQDGSPQVSVSSPAPATVSRSSRAIRSRSKQVRRRSSPRVSRSRSFASRAKRT